MANILIAVKKVKLFAKRLEKEDIMHIAVTFWSVVADIQNGISCKMSYR